jgi:serine/threonine protein kinase
MQFGKYRLIRRLAAGGMAEIFLARQEGMEGFRKELVIKRILPIHADNDELIEMFLDEARIAATLNHPNIVQIFDLGKCDGEYFIAMEYVHGQDLRKIAERGLAVGNFLPLRHAVRIIADAAAGLHYAHNQVDSDGAPMGIVHRDISPQNIIVSFDGVVKILDFGIAKAANKIVTTRHGQLKGKYAYMSPEQCNGLEVDHRSDIFALGTLLYELTVCTRLFKGDTDIQTIKNVSEARITPPSQVRPGFPRDLEEIILKALAVDLNERYASGRALQQALEDFLGNHRMKTGGLQLANYMHEIFPDKQEAPGEDSDFMAEAQAQAQARAQMAMRRSSPAITALPEPERAPILEIPPPQVSSQAEWDEYQSLENTPPPSGPIPSLAPQPPAPPRGAPPGAAETLPIPTAVASGEQISFALNAQVPYAAGAPVAEPARKKKEHKPADVTAVKSVEYRLRSTEDPTAQDRGSRIYFVILALVVIPVLGVAGYLIVKDGNPFANQDSFVAPPTKDPLDQVEPSPPPKALEQLLIQVTSEPPGAAVVINGVLQVGETPGDFKVVPNIINTVSLYKDGFKPRHKNVRAPASGQGEPVALELSPLKGPQDKVDPVKTTLALTSEPEGATILLNGQDLGVTPKTVEVFADIEYHVTLRKEGFQDHVLLKHILPEVENSEPTPRLVSNDRKTADRFTEVSLNTRGVEIKLEDESKGFGPWFQPIERNQVLRVELALQDRYPFRRVLQTTVGSIALSPELRLIQKTPGKLSLLFTPNDGLEVYIGPEQHRPDEVKKIDLPGGEHTVTLVRTADNKRGELKVMVDPENASSYEIDFTGDKPTLRRTE